MLPKKHEPNWPDGGTVIITLHFYVELALCHYVLFPPALPLLGLTPHLSLSLSLSLFLYYILLKRSNWANPQFKFEFSSLISVKLWTSGISIVLLSGTNTFLCACRSATVLSVNVCEGDTASQWSHTVSTHSFGFWYY